MLRVGFGVVCLLALATASPLSKIPAALEQSIKSKGSVDVFVKLESPIPMLNQLKSTKFASRAERKTVVANTIKAFSAQSQKSLLEFLATQSDITVKSFWIANEVYVKSANADLIQKIAERSDVQGFREENKTKLPLETVSKPVRRVKQDELTWGLQRLGVQALWDQGINGTGVRAGMMDSGVQVTHEALRDSYSGDYGWYAPIAQTQLPEDDNGHGTHVMGTILGQGGVGVAPGAKWMACSNIPGGEAEDLACGEFFACPTLPDGTEPNCALAADFVSNSWGYGGGNDFFDSTFAAWEAAGIVPIFAAGNEGPSCTSLRSPGDSAHPALVTVGATDINDDISGFSSFGPSEFDVIKPDIAAPGTDILSSCIASDTSYCEMSGTSMATPHVAGVVALIISAEPDLSVAQIQERLYGGASDTISTSGGNCGGIPESTYPNNHVGHGFLQAASAIKRH